MVIIQKSHLSTILWANMWNHHRLKDDPFFYHGKWLRMGGDSGTQNACSYVSSHCFLFCLLGYSNYPFQSILFFWSFQQNSFLLQTINAQVNVFTFLFHLIFYLIACGFINCTKSSFYQSVSVSLLVSACLSLHWSII